LPLLGLSSREAQALPDAGPFLPLRDAVQARQASARRCDLVGLYAQIWRGSYPALVANPAMDRDLFYASYLQTYLQRDVRDLARVGDQTAFLRFLRAAAARTAQLLNMAELARDAVVIVNQADPKSTPAELARVADGYRSIAREAVTVPHDPAMVDGVLRFGSLRPDTQRAWLAAGAAVARGL